MKLYGLYQLTLAHQVEYFLPDELEMVCQMLGAIVVGW